MSRLLDGLFDPCSRLVRPLWVVGSYLLGIFTWGRFLAWGAIPFDLHDWTQEGPRYTFVRQALLEGRFPLHIGSTLAATDRFLAIPDVVFSAQSLLLRWLNPGSFVLVNTLLLYTLGFLGLVFLARAYKWSAVTFTPVFLVFMLNGDISAQLAVGHSMWASAFLLPWFVLLVLHLVEGTAGWRWVLLMAVLQLVLFAQGGFHFVIWCLFFLLILGLVYPRFLKPALWAILFSILLNLPRILPASLQFAGADRRFISGYFSLTEMLAGLVMLKDPIQAREGMYSSLGWWEADLFIGLAGLAFILYFGIYQTWVGRETHPTYVPLFAPMLGLAVMSLGKVYEPINRLPLPLVDAERVSTRFLLLPVLFAAALAGIALQRRLNERGSCIREKLTLLVILGILAHDLIQHSRLWRVDRMHLLFESTPVNLAARVLNHNDPPYVRALLIGSAAAVISLLVLAWLVYSERNIRPSVAEGGSEL